MRRKFSPFRIGRNPSVSKRMRIGWERKRERKVRVKSMMRGKETRECNKYFQLNENCILDQGESRRMTV